MINPIDFIHIIVAPSVMISSCGLLILGANNKYSLVVNRIRLLNAEYKSSVNIERQKCIRSQVKFLVKRMRLLKNAVWFYTVAIIFFVITMILLGLNMLLLVSPYFILISFVLGILSLLLGAFYGAREGGLGYKIVKDIEVKYHFGIK